LRIAGIVTESVVDGPGVRYVVFAQGCPHACEGCQNPDTWDPKGGYETTPRELIKQIRKAPASIRGVTLSGGEPFMQAAEMADLARRVHALGMNVVTYTGYVYEDLCAMAEKNPAIAQLLDQTDLLVDGPFIMELKDISLRFRGSSNQRLIDMKATRDEGRLVLLADHP
jgi:anaerobic ribonucleoside-triphosphate reductase activating protein